MQATESIRRWLTVAGQIVGLGGTLYEAFWEHGSNPALLHVFVELLLGATGATVPWKSLLQGFQFRFELREPQSTIPTLLIDLGNLRKPNQSTQVPAQSSDPTSSSIATVQNIPIQSQSEVNFSSKTTKSGESKVSNTTKSDTSNRQPEPPPLPSQLKSFDGDLSG